MDPISSSCCNIHVSEDENKRIEERRQIDMIDSCHSLSFYEEKSFKTLLPQIIATAIAGSFHIVIGISLAYSAILIPQLMDAQESGDPDAIQVSKSESSWIASCLALVVPAGALIGGFIMDSVGRLNMVKLAAMPSALGWILIATATNVPMILTGRMLTGIASVWGASPAAVYITEIGRVDMRGSLVTIAPIYISLGMVLGYLKGWLLNWRIVAWMSVAYSILPAFLIVLIPESPAWLVSKGRTEQAKKALEWFHKHQPQPEFKKQTFAEMQLALLQKEHMVKSEEQSRVTGNNFQKKLKMFIKPTAYKPLLILSGLFFFQQFSGIFIILFYGVTFFKEVGTNVNPYLASTFLGLVRLVMSIASAWMMKRYKRRNLYMISAAGMVVFVAISGLYTKWIHEGTTTQNWVPVCMLVLYVLSSMIGLLPIPFTTIAELFPISIRGIGHSTVFSIGNLMMFAALQSFYTLNHVFGGASGIQFFFAVVSFAGLIYGFVFLPETHGKKLSEIEDYFWHHTTYLSVTKEEKQRKPIVKNSGRTEKKNEESEKMILDKV